MLELAINGNWYYSALLMLLLFHYANISLQEINI